jgi:hypothetical protein
MIIETSTQGLCRKESIHPPEPFTNSRHPSSHLHFVLIGVVMQVLKSHNPLARPVGFVLYLPKARRQATQVHITN